MRNEGTISLGIFAVGALVFTLLVRVAAPIRLGQQGGLPTDSASSRHA